MEFFKRAEKMKRRKTNVPTNGMPAAGALAGDCAKCVMKKGHKGGELAS